LETKRKKKEALPHRVPSAENGWRHLRHPNLLPPMNQLIRCGLSRLKMSQQAATVKTGKSHLRDI